MKKITSVLSGLCLVVALGSAGQAAKAEKAKKNIAQQMREAGFKHQNASWTTVTTSVDGNNKTTTNEGKMWISGDKYRMEARDQKGKTSIIIDDGAEMYMYNPEEKRAVKWGPGMEAMYAGLLNSDIVAESARQRKLAKKIGSEIVDGKPCGIYTYKSTVTFMDNAVTSDVKEWVWTKEGFPLKSIVRTPKHKMKIVFMETEVPASETANIIKDLVLDKAGDPALFTLPAGTKVETLDMPGKGVGLPPTGLQSKAGNKVEPAAEASREQSGGEGEEQPKQPQVDVQNILKSFF